MVALTHPDGPMPGLGWRASHTQNGGSMDGWAERDPPKAGFVWWISIYGRQIYGTYTEGYL